MTSKVEFRQATLEDAFKFYKSYPPARFRGFVAEKDGEILMVGGVYYVKGYPVAFSDLSDAVRKDRKTIAKGIRLLCEFYDSMKTPVYALASQCEQTAPYLLAKLGFKPTGKVTCIGEYLVREP
jgi:hypothetical protein